MDGTTQRAAMKGGAGDHESASMMTAAPAPTAASGLKVDRVEIRPTANGGYVVSCSKSAKAQPGRGNEIGPGSYESNDYAFSTLPEVVTFVQQELGAAPAAASAEDAAEAGGAGEAEYQ